MGEIVRKYYETGELEMEYFIFNDKKEGEFKRYYENGQLDYVCNYINDKKEGEFKRYYDNGWELSEEIGRAHV